MVPSKNIEAVSEDICDNNKQDEDIEWVTSLGEHELSIDAVSEDNEDRLDDSKQNEDIMWLASLTEPELDFLISLKDLVAIRAKNIGHKKLIQSFDLKTLRALAFVLLEYFKERARSTRNIQSDKFLGSLSSSGLLDLSSVSSKRKRTWDGQTAQAECETGSSKRKKKKRDCGRHREGEGGRTETKLHQSQ